MAILNPFHVIILPFLFIFTAPIAILAYITTSLAFSVLLFRVIVVYIELVLAVIPYYLLGSRENQEIIPRCKPTTNGSILTARRKKRRSSAASNHSAAVSATGSTTPVPILKGSESALGLSQSIGPGRDYEGVGGWRFDNSGSDDDALWTNMNSRLELPANHGRRHHQRSLTSGSLPSPDDFKAARCRSPEAIMNMSRPRTPPTFRASVSDGGFQQLSQGAKGKKKSSSGSASSTSSKGSSVMNMKQW